MSEIFLKIGSNFFYWVKFFKKLNEISLTLGNVFLKIGKNMKFSNSCIKLFQKFVSNFPKNCVKFSLKLCEIYLKYVWNFLKNLIKFSWKSREIFVKLNLIFLKIASNFLINYVKFSLKLREIFFKIVWISFSFRYFSIVTARMCTFLPFSAGATRQPPVSFF